jgi:opacity protein-like surface antigen
MKTSINTLAKSLLAAIVLTSSIFATSVSADEKQPVKISAPNNFNKLIVSGNVEVTLIQNGREGVSYNDDNTGKVKVIQDGYALKISSEDKSPAKITVYVKNIYRVQASDDAVVKTDGKLDVKYLQVFLKGNAVAKINSQSESLYTVIEGNSDLKLSGATKNHNLVMGKTQKLNLDKFAALKTETSTPEAILQTASLAK